jgi:hypothetical protein
MKRSTDSKQVVQMGKNVSNRDKLYQNSPAGYDAPIKEEAYESDDID